MNLRYAQLACPVLRRSPLRAVVACVLIVAGLIGTAGVVGAALASTGLWEAFLAAPGAAQTNDPLLVITALLAVPVFALPATMLAARFAMGMSVRQVCSVAGRFRWDLYGRCLAASVVVVLVVSIPTVFGLDFSAPTPQWPLLLLIVACLAPLASFAEEFAFRGVLAHLTGAWWARPLWAVGVSAIATSVLFAFAHPAPSPGLFLAMLVGGVGYAVLCDRTGGLEASTATHTAWNLSLFVLVVLVPGGGSAGLGPAAVVQLFVVDAALVVTSILVARRMKVATTVSLPLVAAGERSAARAE